MPLLDSKTVTVATVVALELKGVIEGIKYLDPLLVDWVSTPPTNVPFGQPVGCMAVMRNTGTLTQKMWMKFTLKRPDGSTKSVLDLSAQWQTLAPNATFSASWTDYADQAGNWTMTIELYGDII